ncbi:MAG: hypothetical protein BroJett018_26930 [Chloroflexota bacterium]|nr:MAG: hypothetical protein BroJett018_26930 [Chloroflexota bacterium]
MDRLAEIVKQEVFWYAGEGLGVELVPLANDKKQVYAIAVVDAPTHKQPPEFMIMARVKGDRVIVEADTTDRPLVDALVAAGISRDKIVLAYAGEPIPEGA